MIDKMKAIFRPIYGPAIAKYRHWKSVRLFDKSLGRYSSKRGFIIGSPLYTNLGDSAIFLAQRRFIKDCGYQPKEITYKEYYDYRETIKKNVREYEPIFGMGGGNMGNQWLAEEKIRYDLIHDFPGNRIIIFPQTIHFVRDEESAIKEAKSHYDSHPDLILVAREKISLGIMKKHFSSATILLTPDIVLSTTMQDYGAVSVERSGVLFVTRSDPEKAVPDTTWETLEAAARKAGKECRRSDMYSDIPVTKENRADCVRKKMQEFCGAELVITDRLHGMVFAALTGTPCIAFSNYNHKVKGTYDWISYLPYIRYVETVEEAERAIPELLAMKDCRFDNKPLMPYFDKLAEVIKSHAAN